MSTKAVFVGLTGQDLVSIYIPLYCHSAFQFHLSPYSVLSFSQLVQARAKHSTGGKKGIHKKIPTTWPTIFQRGGSPCWFGFERVLRKLLPECLVTNIKWSSSDQEHRGGKKLFSRDSKILAFWDSAFDNHIHCTGPYLIQLQLLFNMIWRMAILCLMFNMTVDD